MNKGTLLLFIWLLILPITATAISAEDFIVSDDVDDTDKYYFYARMLMADMSPEEKVAQMFIVTPEQLCANSDETDLTEEACAILRSQAVGGVIIRSANIASENQLKSLIGDMQLAAESGRGIPLWIAAEEEGGYVERVAMKLGLPGAPSLGEICASGDVEDAYEMGHILAKRLVPLGFNLNLAPVGDLRSDAGAVIPGRYPGNRPENAAEMLQQIILGMRENGLAAAMKHFPGEADDNEAITSSIGRLKSHHLIPFRYAIEQGLQAIVVSALPVRSAPDGERAMFSGYICEELLRDEMHFEGVIITDILSLATVVKEYSAGEACVKAIKAGCDVMLMPSDFEAAFSDVMLALQRGELTQERIDQSVVRIVALKIMQGLIE